MGPLLLPKSNQRPASHGLLSSQICWLAKGFVYKQGREVPLLRTAFSSAKTLLRKNSAFKETSIMVSGKRLLEMARKWHRMAVASRRKISFSRQTEKPAAEECSGSSSPKAPGKGNFVVYSRDGSRFVVPLAYLDSSVFRELLVMSEEEFGLPSDGPIVMPCDAPLLAQVVSLLRRRKSTEAQKAIIAAISSARCSASAPVPQRSVDHWASTINVY